MSSHRLTRLAGAASAAWGLVLVAKPNAVYARVSGHPGSSVELTATRVLGLRYLAQSMLQLARPGSGVKLLTAIDLTHSVSMGALALRSPAHRRAATVSMLAAAAIATAGVLADGAGSRS